MSVMTATGQDDAPAVMWGRREYKYAGKHLGTGNRCGHDPARLATDRLSLPEVKDGHRVRVIDRLIKRAQEYFANPASVPLLTYLDKKKNRDGSYRQNRSEGREAQSLVMSAIFAAIDLKSLRVGNYTERGEFYNLSFFEIASRCAMLVPSKDPENPLMICSRFWRAVKWLKRAKVIEVYEQYEETPDGKRGRPAIKTVSEKFIRALGGFTKAAMKKARDKSSWKVAKYLAGATQAGVQGVEEAQKLTDEIRSEQTHKVLFPKPAIKNQFPKEVVRDNSADSLVGDYTAYVTAMYAEIAEKIGRPLRGLEGSKLFTQHGGPTEQQWLRRRLKL